MRVFISHSSIDDDFVTRLAASLQAAQVDIWVDHLTLRPGYSWSRAIQQALRDCDTMIVVLSAASVASEEVEAEWVHFLREKKRVVPILIDNCELPYRLGVLHYIDFARDQERALGELMAALGVAPVTSKASGSDEPVPPPVAQAYGDDLAALRDALQNENWARADEITIELLRKASGRELFDSDDAARDIPEALLREVHVLWAAHGHDLKSRDWIANYRGVTTYVALFSFKTYLKRRLEELGL